MSKRETIREVYERQIAEMELTNRTLQAQVHRLQERALVMGELDQLTSRSNNNLLVENEQLRSELARLREQEPVRWHVRGNYFHDGDAAILFASMNAVHGAKVEQLYAAPVPAPAVPQNELVAAITVYLKADDEMHQATRRTGFGGMGKPVASEAEQRHLAAIRHASRGHLEALLQSAEVTNAAADRLLEGGE